MLQNTFEADALDHDATWTHAGDNGGPLWYKQATWSYDLSSYNAGDPVRVEMLVSDCGWGGHGGYAFLDGIGTTYQPPTVPAPGAIVLGALGMSLVGWLRRRRVV